MGGTPRTSLRFASFPAALPGGETLFHRVDARNDETGVRRFYLSTRQYARVKENKEARAEKLRRLRTHRAALQEAAKISGCDLVFSRAAGDNQGANESEVGIIFFGDETNTVAAVQETFPLIHRAFVRLLERAAPG
jgi:hypothetical protein